MENRAHALAAGAFVLFVGAMLIALAYWMGRDHAVMHSYELLSNDAVTGLQPQASVRYKGVNVGRVTDIDLSDKEPGKVIVRISVGSNAPITKSTFATLGFQGLTGLAFVQLDDAGESTELLASDTKPPQRIPLKRGLLSQIGEQGAHLIGQFDQAGARATELMSRENQEDLMKTIRAFGKAAEHLDQFAVQASATFASMKDTSDRLGKSADSVNSSAASFKVMTARSTQPGGTLDQMASAVQSINETTQNLNSTLLPLLNQSVVEAGRSLRQFGQVASDLQSNPQSIVWGKAPLPPGPGESGFVPPPMH